MSDEKVLTEEKQESMEDYRDAIEKSFRKIAEGDIVSGTVIGVTETEVTVDLKYYAQGIITRENFSSNPDCVLKDSVRVGDEITATVIKMDDGEGNIALSGKEASDTLLWERLGQMLQDRTVFSVKISGIVNKGVIANVEGVRAFIPASKLDVDYVENTEEWLGKTVEVMVITADAGNRKLVLSAREVARQKAQDERNTRIAKCQVGAVLQGTVDSLQSYGAFINLDNGLSGLLHISQISMKRIKSPSEVLSVGDKVQVKVISIANNKISLSMRALQEEMAKAEEEETFDYKEEGQVSTSLGSLLAGLKLE